MKKIVIALVVCVVLLAISITGCSNGKSLSSIDIYVPDGGPALGAAILMQDGMMIDGIKVNCHIVDGTTGISSAVLNGNADMAIMPTNMAASMYNKGVKIKHVGNNSYGLLYLVTNVESDFKITDLVGKVVYNLGQGGTPDIVLKQIIKGNSLEYVESDSAQNGKVALAYTNAQTIIQKFKANLISYAVLGEPVLSNALQGNSNLKIAADLQQKWSDSLNLMSVGYPQTSFVVKSSIVSKYPNVVKKVAEKINENANTLMSDSNYLINILRTNGATVPPALTQEGVTRANIKPKYGIDAKKDVVDYLTILKNFDSSLIGGKLPSEDFYYDCKVGNNA